jgi:hypothetical protein
MLNQVDDVKEKIDKMTKNLSLSTWFKDKKDNKATLAGFYDHSKDKIIFPMPPKVSKIVISIGMYQYAQSAHATICSVLTQPLATL